MPGVLPVVDGRVGKREGRESTRENEQSALSPCTTISGNIISSSV